MTSVYNLSIALACFRLGATDYLLLDLRLGQSVSESPEAADSERVDESQFDREGEGKKSTWKASARRLCCPFLRHARRLWAWT
jgi:hypothetical protein